MNQTQKKHLKMFGVVQDYMDAKTEVWSTIPIVVKGKNQFDAELTAIKELLTEEDALSNSTLLKQQAKSAVAVKAVMISGILQAYAAVEGKPEIAKQYTYSKSGIEKMADINVVPAMRALAQAANENLEALTEYAMTADRNNEFISSIDYYESLIGKPREGIVKKGIIVDQLENAFDTANGILRKQMDNMMLLFKESNTDFYNGYVKSRVIED